MSSNDKYERKCDSCDWQKMDRLGHYCDNPQSSCYGLSSVYGWCELYKPDKRTEKKDI